MTSEAQHRAEQKAFERGQEDWRSGQHTNPYPPQSPYYDMWEQGRAKERETEQG